MTTVPLAMALEIPLPVAAPPSSDAPQQRTTAQSLLEAREDLRKRLQVLAGDVDAFWREALACGDFKLVTSSVDASHAVHRALVALDVDRYVVGGGRWR